LLILSSFVVIVVVILKIYVLLIIEKLCLLLLILVRVKYLLLVWLILIKYTIIHILIVLILVIISSLIKRLWLLNYWWLLIKIKVGWWTAIKKWFWCLCSKRVLSKGVFWLKCFRWNFKLGQFFSLFFFFFIDTIYNKILKWLDNFYCFYFLELNCKFRSWNT